MTTPSFETIYSPHETEMLTDAHTAITACELWDWLRDFHPHANEGFMFSRDPALDRIAEAMTYKGHSGSSYAWTMRVMDDIAKNGWEEHKNRVRQVRSAKQLNDWASQQPRKPTGNPCPCRQLKGFTDGWCGVAGGGVPACDH
jgi:hypothetical protein